MAVTAIWNCLSFGFQDLGFRDCCAAGLPACSNACVNALAQKAFDWILPRITEFA